MEIIFENGVLKVYGSISPEEEFKYCDEIFELDDGVIVELDLSDLSFINGELQKFLVDWGDGDKNTVIKHEIIKNDTLDTHSWKKIQHKISVQNKNAFEVEDKFLPKIQLLLYSSSGQIVRIIVSYRIHFRPLSDLSSFTLLSSHTGNDNLTSFVFKESCGGSIIIVQEKDWRKVYQDEVVIHEPVTYSTDKNYNYQDSDDVIWEWNVVPEINMVVKNDASKIYCNFYEKNIGLDDWDGSVFQILDKGDNELVIVDFGDNSFESVFSEGGLYKVKVDYNAINGLSNSTSKYLAIPSDYNPSNVTIDVLTNEHAKEITFSHGDIWFQKKHLNECILSFYPKKIDTSDNGMTLDERNWEIAPTNKKITTITTTDSSGFEIPLKSFPNGLYTVRTITRDLLGNKSESESEIKWVYENVYKPSKIEVSKEGKIEFEIEDESQVDEIEIKLSNDNGIFVVSKPLDEYKNHSTGGYEFTIPPQEVENGDYVLTLNNVLNTVFQVDGASPFRKNGSSLSFTYDYSFDIVSQIEPFIRFNGDEICAFVNYSLDFGGAQPSSVNLIINSETLVLPVVSSSYTGTLIVGENEIEQVVKLGNRTSTASSIIEVTPLDEVKNSIIDYNHLGAARLDYVLENQEYLHFTEEVTELVSGFEIMNKTVLDIHKTGIYNKDGKTYYLTDKDNIFKKDGKQLYTYYKLESYANRIGNTIYNRFVPVNLENRISHASQVENFPINEIKIDTLSTRKEVNEEDFKPTILRYDNTTNTCRFGILNGNDKIDSMNMENVLYGIIKMTSVSNNEEIFYYDVKNQTKMYSESMKNITFDSNDGIFMNVPIGDYEIDLIFSSNDKNKTEDKRYTKENPLNLRAISNYIISVVTECTKNENDQKGTLRVKWTPHYTNLLHSDVKFYYFISKNDPKSDEDFEEFTGNIWTNYDGEMYSFELPEEVDCSGEYYIFYYFRLDDHYPDVEFDSNNKILVEIGVDEETEEPIYNVYRRVPYKLDGESVYDNFTIE